MASKTNFRSISLPSRLHPVNESDLRKLDYCFTSEAIRSGLLSLAELYGSLPQSRESFESSLESSAQLLDSCEAIRELIEMIRENARALESAFRRKGPAAMRDDDVDSYFRSRKKMSKLASKSIKALKHLESATDDDVTKATVSVLRSGLEFLSLPAGRCRWNLASRLTWTMGRPRLDGAMMSEVCKVDSALSGLRHDELSKGVLVNLQRSLRDLEGCVEGIEVGVKRLFRQMLKSRVALLNVLTHH